MPAFRAPQASPFGVRGACEGPNRKLSKLELLFIAVAIFALACLGSLGPKPDPWLETAKAELQSPAQPCSNCSPEQTSDRVDRRFAPTPDSAAAIGAMSEPSFGSEVVEHNATMIPNPGNLPKLIENSRKSPLLSRVRRSTARRPISRLRGLTRSFNAALDPPFLYPSVSRRAGTTKSRGGLRKCLIRTGRRERSRTNRRLVHKG
jgi:hypothetical protein